MGCLLCLISGHKWRIKIRPLTRAEAAKLQFDPFVTLWEVEEVEFCTRCGKKNPRY